MRKHTRIESHRLSGGSLVELTKFGRTYGYMKIEADGDWLTPPILANELSKAAAYAMLETDLREDVLG